MKDRHLLIVSQFKTALSGTERSGHIESNYPRALLLHKHYLLKCWLLQEIYDWVRR